MASDWSRSDNEKYEDLKAQAGGHLRRPLSLEKEADYYRERSQDTTLPAKDRELWEQLADMLDTRLGRNAPPSEQIELF